ncbi:MAG: hypothetical protein FJW35_13210, partial [Acidobacteria bacterium]|nr:hypothetical protein [Acidobacteriota bacterium]
MISRKFPTVPAWVILASLLTLPGGCGSRNDPDTIGPEPVSTPSVPPARHAPFFQAGFAYSHIGGSYDSDVSSLELGKMRAAGGNTVQFIAFAYVYRLDAPGIGMAPERWDQVLRGGISRAKAAGLRAMVKLQTWGPGFQDGKFSADIAMTNAADWRAFMANYRRYVLRYARLAAETDADILCVGTEIWSPAGATHEMRIAPVAAASACAHAAPERDRSGCGAALSGLALTTRFFPGLTPWAVLFRPFGAPHYPNRRVGSRNLDIVASL